MAAVEVKKNCEWSC